MILFDLNSIRPILSDVYTSEFDDGKSDTAILLVTSIKDKSFVGIRILILGFLLLVYVLPVTHNHRSPRTNIFSIGTYGLIGIARGDIFLCRRSLNLNGMGTIRGKDGRIRLLHFTPTNSAPDTTRIDIQSRLALYTT